VARLSSAKAATTVRICLVPQDPGNRDFIFMLSPEEKAFVEYWSVQRTKKISLRKRLSSGLPLALLIIGATFVLVVTGWDKRATMMLRSQGSVILPIVLAAIGIIIFMSVFTARHQWDQNEENYQSLLQKQEREAANQP
jgi:hypothetical protein